jgi:hypothetical protein
MRPLVQVQPGHRVDCRNARRWSLLTAVAFVRRRHTAVSARPGRATPTGTGLSAWAARPGRGASTAGSRPNMPGEVTADEKRRLLATADWDPDRDDRRADVLEHLGDPGGVLAVDKTGFPNKGTTSVGVQRQYSGTTGKVDNCQLGVFLAYASPQGAGVHRPGAVPAPLRDQRPGPVPHRARREQVGFQTKPQLARVLLERAKARRLYDWTRIPLDAPAVPGCTGSLLAPRAATGSWPSGLLWPGRNHPAQLGPGSRDAVDGGEELPGQDRGRPGPPPAAPLAAAGRPGWGPHPSSLALRWPGQAGGTVAPNAHTTRDASGNTGCSHDRR